MSRRVELPGANELFRPTQPETRPEPKAKVAEVTSSKRVRHDEKITVYLSSEELLNLEKQRLLIRAEHGINVDRGRLVREAIAMALEELQAQGTKSEYLSRLAQ